MNDGHGAFIDTPNFSFLLKHRIVQRLKTLKAQNVSYGYMPHTCTGTFNNLKLFFLKNVALFFRIIRNDKLVLCCCEVRKRSLPRLQYLSGREFKGQGQKRALNNIKIYIL